MSQAVMGTLIFSVGIIIVGFILWKTSKIKIESFIIYEISDLPGYRKYLGRNFISVGAWLIVGIILAQFFKNIDILKLDLLTALFVLLEYKLCAGRYMAYDEETGMIKRKYK